MCIIRKTCHRNRPARRRISKPPERAAACGRIPPALRLLLLLIPVLFFFSMGCEDWGRKEDKAVVDFQQVENEQETPAPQADGQGLRIAVGAMVSPRETYSLYRELFAYVARQLDREFHLIQRRTYAEVNQLFSKDMVDLAFICSGPYAMAEKDLAFELLAAPQIHGSRHYRSYLIVQEDASYQSLEDLRGRTFAFTDPKSNTGRLIPLHWLDQLDTEPEKFFDRAIYTYSHDNSILAVARGLVDGAAVDSLIWEFLREREAGMAQGTRVIRKSKPFAVPPIVVSPDMAPELKQKVRDTLLTMHETKQGKAILSQLDIDRFLLPQDSWYDPIREIHTELREKGIHEARSEDH